MTTESGESVGTPTGQETDAATVASTAHGTADGGPDVGREAITLAFYVPSLNTGGAERVTVTVVNELAKRGYDVDLVVSTSGEMAAELASTVSLVNLDSSKPPVIGIGASVPGLISYLRSTEPDLFFPQMTYGSVVCSVATALSGTDTVLLPTEHNTFGMKATPKDRAVDELASWVYRDAQQILAVSEGVAESVKRSTGLREDQVTVTHNPIDVYDISDRSTDPIDHPWLAAPEHEVVLYVGRHEEQKDLETWLAAFKEINEAKPSTRAIIAGKGSKREEMRFIAEQKGLADVVSFPGYVDNPYGYMARADVFMLSSQYEGLPTVLIEALSCGCPIASTDCPSGPDEILNGGEFGSLAPVGDPQALASAALAELRDPPEQKRLFDRATDFSPDAVVAEYERVIQALLDGD